MKNRPLFLTIILVFLSLVYLAEATSFKNSIFYYIAKQKNNIPHRYITPTDTQVSLFRQAVGYILIKDFGSALKSAGAVGYTLKSITHTNGLTYHILESTDPKFRPWGTYVFYLEDDKRDIVIEVPHPIEEKNASKIGIRSFVGPNNDTKATAFLMAGSRIGVGDVVSLPESFFQAAHEASASETTTVVLQIHGFSRRKFPQIILTSGTPVAIPAMDNLIDELIQNDFEVGIYDGTLYSDFGATQNEQAKYSNSVSGSFIGVFLNQAVHHSRSKNNLVIEAIEEYALGETSAAETST